MPGIGVGIGLSFKGKVERLGPELHVSANAASDPNGNEADATTGWIQVGLDVGANIFASQGVVKQIGSYALHFSSNDTPTSNARALLDITVENGSKYKIVVWWRHDGSGGQWELDIEGVSVATIVNTSTTFTKIEYILTAGDTTARLKFTEDNGANDGGIYTDNISVRKIL